MCGRTCGRSPVEAALSHHGRCSSCSAAGAGRGRLFGCISLPPPRSTGRERANRGWPKARWALRPSGQLSSSAWKAIQGDLRSVRVDGVRCPDAQTAALPLLLWWAALDGDSRVLWLCHHKGSDEEAVGVRGDAA